MRAILFGLAIVGLSMALLTGANAGDNKETTLKGTVTCAKCDLKKSKACATVVVTQENGKDVITYFDTASNKKYHAETCTEAKKGTVTGVVTTNDGKRTVAVSALKYE